MTIEKLEELYGRFYDENLKKWAEEKLKAVDAEKEENFLAALQEIAPRKKGIPDREKLSKAYSKVMGKKPKVYLWAVCQNCKTEYAFGLPFCPACYKQGLICRAKDGKKSDFPPPAKVIRYNKEYINGQEGEPNCYNCKNNQNSFCEHFGDYRWTCSKENWEYCECKGCCSKIRSMNQNIEDARAKSTDSYPIAFPYKRG